MTNVYSFTSLWYVSMSVLHVDSVVITLAVERQRFDLSVKTQEEEPERENNKSSFNSYLLCACQMVVCLCMLTHSEPQSGTQMHTQGTIGRLCQTLQNTIPRGTKVK